MIRWVMYWGVIAILFNIDSKWFVVNMLFYTRQNYNFSVQDGEWEGETVGKPVYKTWWKNLFLSERYKLGADSPLIAL